MKNPILLNKNLDKNTSPLFLLHEITGEVFYYSPLAKRLEGHFPVYGLALMNSGIELKNMSIEKLAREYIKCIKTVQPSGPYRLAGWSSGGQIAYEMAYQLLGEGDEVGYLGLIETSREESPPEVPEALCAVTIEDIDKRNGDVGIDHNSSNDALEYVFGGEASRNDFALENFGVEFDLVPILRSIKNMSKIPLFEKDEVENIFTSEIAQSFLQIVKCERRWDKKTVIEKLNVVCCIVLITSRYRNPFLPIDVNLLVTPGEDGDFITTEWKSLLENKLNHCLVAGDHMTMLQPLHVDSLATKIVEGIERSEKKKFNNVDLPIFNHRAANPALANLFFVPGFGGVGDIFSDVIKNIKSDVSVFELRPKGLDLLTVPFMSIAAIARYHFDQIKAMSPRKPVQLVGHSFGACVAFEISQLLLESGFELQLLVLIAPESTSGCGLHSIREKKYATRSDGILSFLEKFEDFYSIGFNITRKELLVLSEDEQINLVLRKIKLIDAPIPVDDVNAFRQALNLFILNSEMNYVPEKTIECPSVLTQFPEKKCDSSFGEHYWEKYLLRTELLKLEGNHMSILKSSEAIKIAKKINSFPG